MVLGGTKEISQLSVLEWDVDKGSEDLNSKGIVGLYWAAQKKCRNCPGVLRGLPYPVVTFI